MDVCEKNGEYLTSFESFEKKNPLNSIKPAEPTIFLSSDSGGQSDVALISRSASIQTFKFEIAKIENKKVPFTQIEGAKEPCFHSPVFPILFHGKKYFKINPKIGIESVPKEVKAISLCEPDTNPSTYRRNCELRLSKILLKGFDNVCKVVLVNYKGEYVPYYGCCNHFVNYLSFGMTYQVFDTPEGWHESLPFIERLNFCESDLHWGDIVELSKGSQFVHFLFYIGDGKFISKHGGLDIYIQDLESSKISYPCDSLRILRLRTEFHDKQIEWQKKY